MASKFTAFASDVSGISIPETFNFPFYYDPHPLSRLAVSELMDYLEQTEDFDHNFGLDTNQFGAAIGKMFGVLVVENSDGELGYISAFSGKLANSNHHERFVPPVFDILVDGDFFVEGEKVLNGINKRIKELESDEGYIVLSNEIVRLEKIRDEALNAFNTLASESKKKRKERRGRDPENEKLADDLRSQSLFYHYTQKDLIKFWEEKISIIKQATTNNAEEIARLKLERKTLSNKLQQQIFNNYTFLSAEGETKSLRDIFTEELYGTPPAGAGECAAPKLLHYAYQHNLKPITFAEFWWGASPKSEVRRHKQFYPSCRGKCEPILGHMLKGLQVDPNPLVECTSDDKTVEIVYEDDHLAVINKPPEMLSQPGRYVKDCVQKRMKERYPDATGPLIVHRLDLSTSGLMLIAKSREVHADLQRQFLKKTIKKRYVAILDGIINDEEGTIDLPLRVDLDDRPRQLVCHEHGKSARTHWKKVSIEDEKTRVHFFPITGRTHQLRVHAAHVDGLHTPIIGDDLYGTKADRLHLHAEEIAFVHPGSGEEVTFFVEAGF